MFVVNVRKPLDPLAGVWRGAPGGTFLKAPVLYPPLDKKRAGYSSGLRPGKEDTRGKAEGHKGKAAEGHKEALYGRLRA